MKRTTLWKIVSVCLLIAVSLPIFSALAPTPVDGLDASSLVAPLPFAMEQYGQHHTDIFKDAAPALDGNADDVYTLLDTYNEGAGHYTGVFSSLNENGSHLNDANEEFIPDLLEIRGSYDDNYVYFYIKTITRNTATGYSITPKFGFNFSDSQSDAHDGTTLPAFTITDTEGVKSGEDFYISTEKSAETVGDSTGEYYVNTTVYEFRVAWSSIAGDLIPEKDFARMYFTLNVPFYNGNTGGTAYWIYGVPNEAPLMGDYLLGTAFGDKADSALPYTPNVVNLQGAKIDESEYPAPAITGVIRNDQNNDKNRSFKVTYTTTKLVEGEAETGILYLADASKIAANHLTANTEGVENLEGELVGYDPDNSIFTYQTNFKTTKENYSKFFALRPYVKYADGTVVYGPYYNLMQLLQRSYPVYAKTGTTDWGKDGMQYGIPEGAMKDKWMVASNSQYTNAVWVGYDMAISGKQTYFTVYKQNLNIPGNICKLLLDAEDTLSEDLPGGVEMPNDVIEQTYVYGTFPHVRMEDWMNGSAAITSLVSKAGAESQPLVSSDEYMDAVVASQGDNFSVSASYDQYGNMNITWGSGDVFCSGGSKNISLHDQWNDIDEWGTCLVDLSWLARSSGDSYWATIYVDGNAAGSVSSNTSYFHGWVADLWGTVKVCGGSSTTDKTSCVVAHYAPVEETWTEENQDGWWDENGNWVEAQHW